jgi:hypothetical protein
MTPHAIHGVAVDEQEGGLNQAAADGAVSMLWLVQHKPPASMHSRSASPRARNRPQVPMVVPMMGAPAPHW